MEQAFDTEVLKEGSQVFVELPFDPDDVWGEKPRHYVRGTINDCLIRSLVRLNGGSHCISLGNAWRRDNGIGAGDKVSVVLEPEGPQLESMAEDIATALSAAPDAVKFFDSLATFYRRNYIRWIESAKRPETRQTRIAEMVKLLKAGKRQK